MVQFVGRPVLPLRRPPPEFREPQVQEMAQFLWRLAPLTVEYYLVKNIFVAVRLAAGRLSR